MASAWTVQRLYDSIGSKEIYPLYLFEGDETFLMDEAVKLLEEAIVGEGMRDFNLNTFFGGEAEAAQIRDAVETLPVMAQARLVIVKNASDLTDKEWEQLMPLIEEPVPSTAFICAGTKFDRRKRHIKKFMEKGVVVEFKRPYDNQIPDWIRELSKRQSLKMSPDAVAAFHELVGSNLHDIQAELTKLKEFIGNRNQVSIEDVEKAVTRVRLDTVFQLTDAIAKNDRQGALVSLANLLENGQNEIGVLAMISRHVRILKLINDGIREGLSGQKLSSRAGVQPFRLKTYVEQARVWNQQKIERTFRALLDTDRALKSSPVASHIWLENFVVQTCS